MKFSILLINPGPVFNLKDRGKGITRTQLYPPLSLLYITAVLKNNNYQVDIIDQSARRMSFKAILKHIKQREPEIVAFSTLIHSYCSVTSRLIAQEIKKWNPNLKIVFGNRHATYNDYRILQAYPFVDVCVRGEGEYTFLELVEAFSKGNSLKDVKGITYRENGKVRRNEDRELIKNLDELPFPDRSLLDYDYRPALGGIQLFPSGFTTISASRGCPFNCRFCCSKDFYGHRVRSVENIIEEFELLESEGFKFLNFIDDHFTVNKKRVLKFCTLLKKNRIDVDWACEGRVDQVSLEMLRGMSASNCRILFYGIESANQRILDYYRKGITPNMSLLAVKKARQAKIPFIMGSFVVGAPDETLPEIQNTLRFAERLDIDFPLINLLSLTPGCDMWSELVADGLINEELYWETGVTSADIGEGIDEARLMRLIMKTLRNFFVNPQRILKTLFRFFTSSYKLRSLFRVFLENLQNLRDFAGANSLNVSIHNYNRASTEKEVSAFK